MARVSIGEVSTEQKALWAKMARQEDRPLASWIRRTLDAAAAAKLAEKEEGEAAS